MDILTINNKTTRLNLLLNMLFSLLCMLLSIWYDLTLGQNALFSAGIPFTSVSCLGANILGEISLSTRMFFGGVIRVL